MLERYERCLTVSSILDSSVPDKLEAAGWSEDPGQEESQRFDSFTSFVVSNKRLHSSRTWIMLLNSECVKKE